MNTAYHESLSKIKAYREQRDAQKEFIYKNPELLPILYEIACNSNDKNQNKALWIVELICEEQITLYTLYIEDFCNALKTFKDWTTGRWEIAPPRDQAPERPRHSPSTRCCHGPERRRPLEYRPSALQSNLTGQKLAERPCSRDGMIRYIATQ